MRRVLGIIGFAATLFSTTVLPAFAACETNLADGSTRLAFRDDSPTYQNTTGLMLGVSVRSYDPQGLNSYVSGWISPNGVTGWISPTVMTSYVSTSGSPSTTAFWLVPTGYFYKALVGCQGAGGCQGQLAQWHECPLP